MGQTKSFPINDLGTLGEEEKKCWHVLVTNKSPAYPIGDIASCQEYWKDWRELRALQKKDPDYPTVYEKTLLLLSTKELAQFYQESGRDMNGKLLV